MRARSIIQVAREWAARLRGSFGVRSRDAEYRAELAYHLELAEERFRQQGYSAVEAARLARVRYGQTEQAIEDIRKQQGIPWFGVFTLDVKLGLRMLRKHLGLTLVGGLAMSVGFSLILAVFVYFDFVMWADTVPLDEGDRVVAIQVWDAQRGRRSEIGIEDFQRFRDRLRLLEDVGAFRTVERGIVHDNGEIERIPIAEISASGFVLARVTPVLGRTLFEEDEVKGARPVVVIGYDEWQSRFNGAVDVLGRTLRLDDRFHTIVGVMPEEFGFPVNHQFWVPLQASVGELLSAPPAGAVFARLAPGATLQRVQAELAALGLAASDVQSETSETLRPAVLPYAQNFIDDLDPSQLTARANNARLIIFFVSLLLIPPCVNIAMLVYARAVTRKEEIAVRTALGASRRRIVLQLFIETLVLSTIAVGVALVTASVLLEFAQGQVLNSIGRLPFWLELGLTFDTFVFAAALAVAAAVIIGVIPALGATKSYARPGLSALDGRHRNVLGPVWTALIIGQIALPFAALPSAVELGWGVLRAHVLGPGFEAQRYLTAQIGFDGRNREAGPDVDFEDRYAAARDELIRRIESDPRVLSAVAAGSALPGEGQWRRFRLEPAEDLPSAAVNEGVVVGRVVVGRRPVQAIDVDDRYFEVLEFELLAGRLFDAGEYRSTSRAVIVSATFAEIAFPGLNPLGRRFTYEPVSDPESRNTRRESPWYQIVGVTADRPAHSYSGSVYHAAERGHLNPVKIAFRSDTADGQFREQLNSLAAAVDPALELADVRTLEELYDGQALGNYIGGFVIAVVSLSVLSLAAAGTYALMSFTVNQRRREIAIRMALGARPRKLLRGIFRRALRQVSIGAAVGLALALLVQSYVPATALGGLDVPGALPGALAFLVLIGLGASLAPARRALRTNPTECLSDST